jgi:hypothetical protein
MTTVSRVLRPELVYIYYGSRLPDERKLELDISSGIF